MVILAADVFDCMKLTEAGFHCVALPGGDNPREQEELLCEYMHHRLSGSRPCWPYRQFLLLLVWTRWQRAVEFANLKTFCISS